MSRTIEDVMPNHDKLTAALVRLTDGRANGASLPSLAQIADSAGLELDIARDIVEDEHELMIAVAEVALIKMIDWTTRRITSAPVDDPVAQITALGEAYLDWAFDDLAAFRVIYDRRYIDLDNEPRLSRYAESIRRLVLGLIERARDSGRISRDADIDVLMLAARAFVYGLARMAADDHLQGWVPTEEPLELSKRSFRDYVSRMVGDQSAAALNGTIPVV
ncbi:WHG domain-containing protein [Paracoccus sp. TK19116]|uniref:WHG domain-containing protein n=1 Tax=Paracoccus albicereus TaxID=2922394 RepID=A0ABT1MP13_9RHOB|nr:TetR-like C-terminal domain-containing protein [Paracoccus albicereus]MCQ0969849.1 WHG domain-containing protein [Paracoccus albicereus]